MSLLSRHGDLFIPRNIGRNTRNPLNKATISRTGRALPCQVAMEIFAEVDFLCRRFSYRQAALLCYLSTPLARGVAVGISASINLTCGS